MTLDAIRCFCAILDTGSFRAAAARVHRSQPAVSQQLKSLERELGHPLIDRRTTRPTEMGQLVYRRAQALLDAADGLVREVQDVDAAPGQELRVGASDTLALYLLPGCVKRFAAAMPQVRLVLLNRNSDALVAHTLRGDLDLGIVTLPEAHAELDTEPLIEQRLVLAVPAKHRLAKAGTATLEALRNEPFLLLEGNTRTGALLRAHFAQHGFAPQTVLDSGSFEVIKRYIAEGIGVSFLPDAVLTPRARGIATVAVAGLPVIPIGAIGRKHAYRSRAARVFLDLLREAGGHAPREVASEVLL
jgi:DNA-binding transcriptional LysR family regulator